MLLYPRCHLSESFNAGIPIDRSVHSITVNSDCSRARLQSESAAIHDPEIEGRPNSGGRIYNSRDIMKLRLKCNDQLKFSAKRHRDWTICRVNPRIVLKIENKSTNTKKNPTNTHIQTILHLTRHISHVPKFPYYSQTSQTSSQAPLIHPTPPLLTRPSTVLRTWATSISPYFRSICTFIPAPVKNC
jgi:hypothetical protein